MIITHALMYVNPERRTQFLEEVKPMIAATHAEEGNLSYELYEHADKENVFIMVETWRDSEAISAHNTSSHFTTFAGKSSEFLTAPLELKEFNAEQVNK